MHCQWQFSIANCYFTRGYIMVIVIIHEQVVSVNPPHDFGSTAILFYKLSTKNKHWSQPFHLPIQEGTTSISIPKCMICLHVCTCPVCPACPVCFVRLFVCLCLYLFMSTYIYIYIYTHIDAKTWSCPPSFFLPLPLGKSCIWNACCKPQAFGTTGFLINRQKSFCRGAAWWR